MRRKLFAGALILICLSIVAYGTIAYFTADDVAHNVITSGDIQIEIKEWANADKTETFPENGITGVMPGTEVTKIAEVKNTGGNAAYIRVKVEKSIRLTEATPVTAEPDLGLLTIDFDTTQWTEGDDGYYYYNVALVPGETTAPLFSTIGFDKTMGNDYQNSTATVTVKVYAVQVANNGDTVFDAAGWPEE